MKIAVIVAMGKELNLLLPHIEGRRETTLPGGATLHLGSMADGRHEVAAMQSGIGKVNAALGVAMLIDTFKPDIVINTGVAGGTGSDARVMDVVVGEKVAYHDVWCGPCAERGQIQGLPHFFEGAKAVLDLPVLNSIKRLHRGLIASGDQFVDNAADLAKIVALYPDVKAVDMESAAMAHTCYVKGVPFVSIRVVSDTPGKEDDNTGQYLDFWTDAPQATFDTLQTIINAL
jgi:adenosylhomocysteine nucleosidase